MSRRDDDRRDQASLKAETEALKADLVARGALAIGISADAPAEATNAFLRHVHAVETGATTTTLLAELQRIGIDVPPPSELSDEALTARLWKIIHGLATLNVFLEFTDHLSDRALYERLHGEILPDEMDPLGTEEGAAWHISIIGGCSVEDNLVYLKYYADEGERRKWQADWPDGEIPAHEDLPYDRDRLLPDLEG
jgi:hypothetical protein